MIRPAFSKLLAARSGTALLEFALIAPILLAVIGGLADFGLAFFDQSQLADAVTAGSQYAFSQGQINQTAQATDVQQKVQNALTLAGASVTITGPTIYCVTRNTAANPPTTSFSTNAAVAGQPCNSNGNLPGLYMTITASYTYSPIMPLYSQLAQTTLQEVAYVRLF